MNDDFSLVRDAFAESVAGRALRAFADIVQAAWRTSVTARVTASMTSRTASMTPAQRLATVAGAIAIASALQPLLMMLMPRTVVPAFPSAAFAAIAMFAAAIAWRPAPFLAAWRDSLLSRWSRR